MDAMIKIDEKLADEVMAALKDMGFEMNAVFGVRAHLPEPGTMITAGLLPDDVVEAAKATPGVLHILSNVQFVPVADGEGKKAGLPRGVILIAGGDELGRRVLEALKHVSRDQRVLVVPIERDAPKDFLPLRDVLAELRIPNLDLKDVPKFTPPPLKRRRKSSNRGRGPSKRPPPRKRRR